MEHEWAAGYSLQLCGQYFQGFVDDYEVVLSHHKIETVTSYGIRKSRRDASKENAAPADSDSRQAAQGKKSNFMALNLA